MSKPAIKPRPFNHHFKWGGTLVMMVLILLLDQPTSAGENWLGQLIGGVMAWAYLAYLYGQVVPRLKRLMLIGLVMGLVGELFLAFGLGMYQYRFNNIPFYVPPGHVCAMVFAYLFTRENWVRAHHRGVEAALFLFSLIYAVSWMVFKNDLYGFILYFGFVITIWAAPTSRLFFLTIFAVTTYMELIGTTLGCWAWHPILMNRFESLPGANPPGGISFLYLFFDIGCLGIYLLTDLPLRARYDRLKAFKKMKAKQARPGELSPLPMPAE